ncbi:MAG: hypothetical protein Q4C34_07470 [Bacteroidales bacterium]|nr:hypothetical protein [Bacteroidales bacterium]
MTVITAEQLKTEELRLRYLELIEKPDVFPTRANWQFIISHGMLGLGPALYRKYLASRTIPEMDREELHDIAVEQFPAYLCAVPRRYAVETVYSDFTTDPASTASLIRECRLFDARGIMAMIQAGRLSTALDVIDTYSAEYTADDLAQMQSLVRCLDSLPELGSVEQRRGLLGSSVKYICPRGHVNDGDRTYCGHSGCGLDIHGLTSEQADRIEILRHRVRALATLISGIGD